MIDPRLTVRLAVLADAEAVVALWEQAGFLSYTPDPLREVSEALKNPSARLVVGELRTAGPDVARVVATGLGTHDGRRGWIFRLAVDATVRGLGIGQAVVAGLEKWFAAEGLVQVNLLVFQDNVPARAFWERLGYGAVPPVEMRTKRLADPAGAGR